MKIKNILENFIIIAIVLVIVQTFLQELSVYKHWQVSTRHMLIVSGLFFDLIFSIEFIARSVAWGKNKNIIQYWLYERGWVDFLSSLPLLIFDSGPSVFILLTGHTEESISAIGVLNVLKVVKAVRVTRILRLVRIIKIFGKIHNAESQMAQHHTASIATTVVFTIVMTLIGMTIFTEAGGHTEIDKRKTYYSDLVNNTKKLSLKQGYDSRKAIKEILHADPHVLHVYYRKNLIMKSISKAEFNKKFTHEDYKVVKAGAYTLDVSIVDLHRALALQHMESFFIIVLSVLSIMLIYTRHFVQNISDIIHIMNKGFRKKEYNLQVKIRKEYASEEVFRLARFYNDSYLPAKSRWIHNDDDKKKTSLSMNDLINFKGK